MRARVLTRRIGNSRLVYGFSLIFRAILTGTLSLGKLSYNRVVPKDVRLRKDYLQISRITNIYGDGLNGFPRSAVDECTNPATLLNLRLNGAVLGRGV